MACRHFTSWPVEPSTRFLLKVIPAHEAGILALLIGRLAETVKLAVTDLLEFMVTVAGLVEPTKSPDQPEKLYPALGVTVRVTMVPDV